MDRNWNNFPFAPGRFPFFYGWVIVAATTLAMIASIPGQTMGVGVFSDALIVSLGLTRLELSFAYMLGTIGSSLMLPLAGTLLDRVGSRVMVVLSSIGLGLSTAGLAAAPEALRLLPVRGVWAAGAIAFIAFLFLRFFGQGCLTMAGRVALGKWFNHRRGLAAAWQSVFVGFGFSYSPQVLEFLLQRLGWQGACLIMALGVGVVMSFLGWLFFRDNPEDCGQEMDGPISPSTRAALEAKVPDVHKEFTRREALSTFTFWMFNLGASSQALIVTAFTFHLADLGAELGIGRTEIYTIFLPMSVFSIGANFLGGWLSDRIPMRWLLMVQTGMQALATVGLFALDLPWGWWTVIVAFGISNALFVLQVTVAWPRFFGREHLGAINGVNMSTMVFASAIGPVMFSAARGFTGVYTEVILAWMLVPMVLLLGSVWAVNPQERYA